MISPPKTSAQTLPSRTRSSEPVPSLSPSPSPVKPKPAATSRAKGFKIGGAKATKVDVKSNANVKANDQQEQRSAATEKPVKKGFAIGGKQKSGPNSRDAGDTLNSTIKDSETAESLRATADKQPSLQQAPPAEKKAALVEDEEHDETAEEKAERKRRELKRKNEELAKKQAQKKKKRF